ncbi:MAG: hypothetical protein IKP95_04915 [Ruminococcus sp.]|nr:hypothetical protein [Ruminococcus sp.]
MKIIAIILAAVIVLAGCASDDKSSTASEQGSDDSSQVQSSETDDSAVPIDDIPQNETIAVVDREGKRLGEIHQSGTAVMTDYGIFYRARPEGATDQRDYEYRLFDPKEGSERILGSISGNDYEPGYAWTELDGCLYTVAIIGNLMNDEPEQQHLYRFDLKNGTMEDVRSIEGRMSPYTCMTSANGKIILCEIREIDGVWTHDLIEYDPASGSSSSIMTYTLEGSENGDAVRQLTSDGEHIYVLRVSFKGSDTVALMMDTYDFNYQKLSEQDLTPLYVQSMDPEHTVQEDIDTELRQAVDCFRVIDGRYVYYENFSVTRFFGDVKENKILTETHGLFASSLGSGSPFWFWVLGGRIYLDSKSENRIFELKDGSIEESEFNDVTDSRYEIVTASVSQNGTRLILMEYKNPKDSSDTLPSKYYVI